MCINHLLKRLLLYKAMFEYFILQNSFKFGYIPSDRTFLIKINNIIYFVPQKRQRKYFFLQNQTDGQKKSGVLSLFVSFFVKMTDSWICWTTSEISSSRRFSSYASLSSTMSRRISNFEIVIYRMFVFGQKQVKLVRYS